MNWLATLCPCSHFKLSATEELCSFASKSAQFKLLSFTIIVSSVFSLSQLIFVFNTSCTQHSLLGTLSTSPCLPTGRLLMLRCHGMSSSLSRDHPCSYLSSLVRPLADCPAFIWIMVHLQLSIKYCPKQLTIFPTPHQINLCRRKPIPLQPLVKDTLAPTHCVAKFSVPVI